jgi:hypothetical protein
VILIFEMTWLGIAHVPGNSATIQTIAQACPGESIRVFAGESHLTELQRDPALTANTQIELIPIDVFAGLQGRTQIVSFGRFRKEFAALRRGLSGVPHGEPCLLFLLSATSTAIFAASFLTRWRRGIAGVHIGMHGNLNDLTGWRSRNPLARAFDLNAAMRARHPRRFRFLVLERAIKDALAALIPQAAERTDVLRLPINLTEIPPDGDMNLSLPIRVGLVGQATRAKGIDVFLDLARDMRARHGDAIAFYLVGQPVRGGDLTVFAPLAHAVTHETLSRDGFLERLAGLHYVLLPLREEYYGLSASGALIDAITWLKPVIASPLPIVAELFGQFGEIGYQCDGLEGFRAVLEGILANVDAARYRRQVDAMRLARDSRLPGRLAIEYRAILRREFPGLLNADETTQTTQTPRPRYAHTTDASVGDASVTE